jgi:hypothetical protein
MPQAPTCPQCKGTDAQRKQHGGKDVYVCPPPCTFVWDAPASLRESQGAPPEATSLPLHD